MGLDRRTFLQRAGLALFSLGVSEAGISLLGNNDRFAPWLQAYGQTLAQTTNRKLALLVGINQYPKNKHLNGCVTDVELQKDLLIHRFGFLPQDIVTLTDRQATRENIETAFLGHLTEQAKADDVVVFHFSGYGGRVKMPNTTLPKTATEDYQLVESLVPVDGLIPTKGNPAANDLLKDTLFSLLRSLKTDKITTVLDTGFKQTNKTLQGNFRVRSYYDVAQHPSPEERAFHDQMQIRLKAQGLKYSNLPGIILSAAGEGQPALEGQWHNFSAGLFTYALTQYLWQVTPATRVQSLWQKTLANVAIITDNQHKPQIRARNKPITTYYPLEKDGTAGEGLITGIDNKGMVDLKLTGIPLALLDSYGLESCFTVVEDTPNKLQIQLRSREGIHGKGQILNSSESPSKLLQSGQFIQESIRVLPRNQGLTVALDNSLERIERVDATSALANIDSVTNKVMAGEYSADCILGKVTDTNPDLSNSAPEENPPTAKSYGLFTPGGTLMTKTVGVANEAVKLAVKRLETEFQTLLANKWLQLIVNDNSSLIPLEATLELSGKKNYVSLQRNTRNASSISRGIPIKLESLPTITQDAPLKLSLTNNGESTLYSILMEVTPTGQITTLYKPQKSSTDKEAVTPINWEIPAKSKLVIPQANSSWQWNTPDSKGIAQLYVIVATQPFNKTLALLSKQATVKRDRSQILNLLEPLGITYAILQDLHNASGVTPEIIGSNTDVYGLDNHAWATFRFTYEIV